MLLCLRPHRGRRRIILLPSKLKSNLHANPPSSIPQLPYNISSLKFCLKNSNKYYSFAHVIFGILLLVINFSSCSCRHLPPSEEDQRPDFICNSDGSHKCVCNRFSGNLDNEITECTQFLGVPTIPAIKIILHKVNLEARLHTNETYQQYFRRRIANLISQFCERHANECPGTPLRIPKVDIETTTKLFLDDEYEPPITQDNVVILRVNFLDHDRTELYFVVTKDSHVQILSQDTLMEPSKIKLILSAQIGPLSRVLGGVHIHELQMDEIHRLATLDNDNSRIYKIIIGIVIFFGIIYTVAVTKCLKQTSRKKRLKKKREAEQKYGPSYGACTEKLLSEECEKRNGKPKSSSIASRESISSGKGLKKISEVVTATLKTPTYDDDRPSLDARSFNRMFACDPSQLPAEYHRLSAEQDDDSVNLLMPSPPSSARSILPTKEDPLMPSVIFISSGTPDTMGPNVPKIEMCVDSPEPGNAIKSSEPSSHEAPPSLLETTTGYNPFDRPLSRRGSRNSTPEEGEEFAEDREDTPQPLGDEASIVQKLEKLPKPADDEIPVVRSHTAHKFGHWSSDSDSENEVYQRLSEVSEEEELDEENIKRKKRKIQKNASSDLESVTSDEEDKEIDEEEALERHQYKRLQESPTPSKPPLPDMSMELDSALQYP